MAPPVKLFLSDVDGTLVTPHKILTDRAIAAVQQLKKAGILFAVTSGRPPRGMSMLIEPLGITTPLAAFNGGVFVNPDMSVIEQKTVPDDVTPRVIALFLAHGIDVWVYRGSEWYVRDPNAPHVDIEAETVRFEPTTIPDFSTVAEGVAKIVGVSDDHDGLQKAVDVIRDRLGDQVSASRSQPYYADVTHPDANKGGVVKFLSAKYGLDETEIATIGDMPNDILMFARSGLSIAMGQSGSEVHRAARRVTTSNDDEGFANAVERYILAGPGEPEKKDG
jgi:Cof subfamily protein (haloacid dehalogenase superfamily)